MNESIKKIATRGLGFFGWLALAWWVFVITGTVTTIWGMAWGSDLMPAWGAWVFFAGTVLISSVAVYLIVRGYKPRFSNTVLPGLLPFIGIMVFGLAHFWISPRDGVVTSMGSVENTGNELIVNFGDLLLGVAVLVPSMLLLLSLVAGLGYAAGFLGAPLEREKRRVRVYAKIG